MAYENHEDGETMEKVSALEGMMKKMDDEDRLIIENEFFNSPESIPLTTVLGAITDKEEARIIMGAFHEYLNDRNSLQKEERRARVQEVNDFIERRLI